MSIILDGVSCLLHLSIMERILDHSMINRDDALEMMVDYLGANLRVAMKELEAL